MPERESRVCQVSVSSNSETDAYSMCAAEVSGAGGRCLGTHECAASQRRHAVEPGAGVGGVKTPPDERTPQGSDRQRKQ